MSRRNKYDRKDSLEIGESAQFKFKELAEAKGWKVTPANEQQDIHEHWDFFIEKDGEQSRVDVKAMKRIRRSDPYPQDKLVWIELHGVRDYDEGWLYGGGADHIAFETKQGFIIVKRQDLIELLEKTVDFKDQVSSPAKALYKIYQRPGRPDKITMIETRKLLELRYAFWIQRTL